MTTSVGDGDCWNLALGNQSDSLFRALFGHTGGDKCVQRGSVDLCLMRLVCFPRGGLAADLVSSGIGSGDLCESGSLSCLSLAALRVNALLFCALLGSGSIGFCLSHRLLMALLVFDLLLRGALLRLNLLSRSLGGGAL